MYLNNNVWLSLCCLTRQQLANGSSQVAKGGGISSFLQVGVGFGLEDVPVTMVNDMKTTNFAIGKATLHEAKQLVTPAWSLEGPYQGGREGSGWGTQIAD